MDGEATPGARDALALMDWKRRVFAAYAAARAADDPRAAWDGWRGERDRLFRDHPQSPLPAAKRSGFDGLRYFAYDAAYGVEATIVPGDAERRRVAASTGAAIGFTRIGTVAFALPAGEAELPLFWLDGYGGGLFLPFGDAGNGSVSYGGGRYLLDTVKGADLGARDGRLVLDFNFAYNPSCAYDPRWTCPLAPPESRLSFAVAVGERDAEI